MKNLLIPVSALLLSAALLLLGQGLILTLLPLRAELEQFTASQIGLTASSYFLGFVLSCLYAPYLIQRVGHIRSFAVMGSTYSAIILLFHAFPNFEVWLVLRFAIGSCICALYMIIESWLNERATSETRGTLLSIYNAINLIMIMLGQQLLNLADPAEGQLFGLAAIVLSVAIIPISLTLSLAPAPVARVKLDFGRIWQLSHVAVIGAATSGLVTGAFWAMGPVYARALGIETAQLTVFLSATVFGGALFQLPLGRLSDYLDRRLVLLFSALAGAAISIPLSMLNSPFPLLLLFALIWGGSVMTAYSICLAHAADHASPTEFVMIGSGILLLFSACSALGAPLAALLMSISGAGGLFQFSAFCLLAFAGSISIRRQQHPLPVFDQTGPFVSVPRTSPALFDLDPRTDTPAHET